MGKSGCEESRKEHPACSSQGRRKTSPIPLQRLQLALQKHRRSSIHLPGMQDGSELWGRLCRCLPKLYLKGSERRPSYYGSFWRRRSLNQPSLLENSLRNPWIFRFLIPLIASSVNHSEWINHQKIMFKISILFDIPFPSDFCYLGWGRG